jgi:exonuclease SbcC
MQIKKLSIKNFIGIEELNLEPGKVNIISGKNAKGKTSILEAIEKTFTNRDRRPRIIREGAEQAIILIETDEGTKIRRSVTAKGSRVSIDKEGFKANSPQTMLQGLVGQFSFNPVDFLTRDEKEQTNILLAAAKIEVTPQDVKEWIGEDAPINTNQHGLKVCQELHKYYYEQRRDANADVKAVAAEVETIKIPQDFDPEQYRNVSLREKYDAIREANNTNRLIEQAKAALDGISSQRENINQRAELALEKLGWDTENKKTAIKTEIERLQKELSDLDQCYEKKATDIENHRIKLQTEIDTKEAAATSTLENCQYTDIEPLEQEVEQFEEMQKLVRDWDAREQAKKRLTEAKKEAGRLDSIVKTLAAKPQELVAKANLPIDGLGVNDGGNVTINDRPIKSLSTSEQIRIALEIAKATTGTLKIICIDGLEALDKASKDELLKQISTDEYQYFITEVGDGEMQILQGVS